MGLRGVAFSMGTVGTKRVFAGTNLGRLIGRRGGTHECPLRLSLAASNSSSGPAPPPLSTIS